MILESNSSAKSSTQQSTRRTWSVCAQSLAARFAVLFVMAAAIGVLFVPSSSAATVDQIRFNIRVLVLTTFDGETQPWLTHEQWPLTFNVSGAAGKTAVPSPKNSAVPAIAVSVVFTRNSAPIRAPNSSSICPLASNPFPPLVYTATKSPLSSTALYKT